MTLDQARAPQGRDLSIFDAPTPAAKGKRYLSVNSAHYMMAAAPCFISGAISDDHIAERCHHRDCQKANELSWSLASRAKRIP